MFRIVSLIYSSHVHGSGNPFKLFHCRQLDVYISHRDIPSIRIQRQSFFAFHGIGTQSADILKPITFSVRIMWLGLVQIRPKIDYIIEAVHNPDYQ